MRLTITDGVNSVSVNARRPTNNGKPQTGQGLIVSDAGHRKITEQLDLGKTWTARDSQGRSRQSVSYRRTWTFVGGF